ncbi:adenosylhomocysteine nucleosidase [Balneicella halophila]|uniref:adenosylhomocysteine nucleosidase n=1 Tax=Balneicella halophila TaxID=1537566 RepID=A0A7L4UNZ8_BALHA|nr:5'-methylthioadenosine/adenosylhomocysteine nucleosidase [Balneicella halophila]PVX49393.1 adenosylhomocysteine nucleosidase [Balneicella halophila]
MKIGIIGAMQVEVETLQQRLIDRKDTKVGTFVFSEGKIDNVTVIVCLSGIGKVSAAVGTTFMIERYTPDYIINTGTAGGLGVADVHDIILATEVRHHDVDVTAFGYEIGQQAQQPPAFLPNESLLEVAKSVCAKHTDKVIHGLIVSGDAFISDPERVSFIVDNFPTALAVEMEAAAIAQVCYQLDVPFLVLRAISDKAGEGDAEMYVKFVEEAGKRSAKMNIDLISTLASKY